MYGMYRLYGTVVIFHYKEISVLYRMVRYKEVVLLYIWSIIIILSRAKWFKIVQHTTKTTKILLANLGADTVSASRGEPWRDGIVG